MEETRTDWEKLFEKCATNREYRKRLDEALAAKDQPVVRTLLGEIGIHEGDVDRQMAALTAARQPLVDIAGVFDSGGIRLAP